MAPRQTIRAKIRVVQEFEVEGYHIFLNKPLASELKGLEEIIQKEVDAGTDAYPHELVTMKGTPRILLDSIELLGETENIEDLAAWEQMQRDWPVDTEVWVPAKEASVMINVLPSTNLVLGRVCGYTEPETWEDDEPTVVVRLRDQNAADPGFLQIATKKLHLARP